MKLLQPIAVRDLASQIDAELLGDETLIAQGINEIHHVEAGDISFVDHPQYYDAALASAASIILIDKIYPCPPAKALLVVAEPFAVYNRIINEHRPHQPLRFGVSPDAQIGEGTYIEPGAIIGPNVRIGRDCYIGANAYVGEYSVLGDRVVVQVGAIIGSDAFYYKKTAEGFQKWRSGGFVILEDDVEIGPGCTIAKGVSAPTRIGEGCKLDAQCHIGHDVQVGKFCLIAAQVGIAGNTHIGEHCFIYGQAGIAQNLRIGDRVVIGAKSGVSKNLDSGKTYLGYPAGEAREVYKQLATLRRLADGKL
jgi:UDP-3-O-[3-hydroxymyristoyl] glucosamine N-acyltransferase